MHLGAGRAAAATGVVPKYPKASTTRLARPAWLYTLIEPKLLRVATVRFGKIGPALPFTSEVTNHTLPG